MLMALYQRKLSSAPFCPCAHLYLSWVTLFGLRELDLIAGGLKWDNGPGVAWHKGHRGLKETKGPLYPAGSDMRSWAQATRSRCASE